MLEEIKGHADEVKVDALGNVLATKARARRKKRLRVMLSAHMDEVGFMLVADDGEGLFRFETVGGMDVRQLPGKAVLVGQGARPRRDRGTPDPPDHRARSASRRSRWMPCASTSVPAAARSSRVTGRPSPPASSAAARR